MARIFFSDTGIEEMSSVGSSFAQRLTRTFIVTQDAQNSEYGATYFTESDIDAWVADYSSNVTRVSSGLIIVSGTFNQVIDNLNSSGTFERKRSLTDMGTQIVIGNSVESRLVVLRKVQEPVSPTNGGDGVTGYIVVESNYRSENWPTPSSSKFNVNVARA